MARRGSPAAIAATVSSAAVPGSVTPDYLRSAYRSWGTTGVRSSFIGFRLGRTLLPLESLLLCLLGSRGFAPGRYILRMS